MMDSNEIVPIMQPFVSAFARVVVKTDAYNFSRVRKVLEKVFGADAYQMPTSYWDTSGNHDRKNKVLQPKYIDWLIEQAGEVQINKEDVPPTENLSWVIRLASLLNEDVSLLGVWRLTRESSQSMPYTLFDEVEKDSYPLPTITKEVAGSHREEYVKKGYTYVWLLSVVPSMFEDLYNFPVGGHARFNRLYGLSIHEILRGHGQWTEFWHASTNKERREADKSLLVTMMGLNGGFTDMLGSPVVSSHTDFVLKNWSNILFSEYL